MPRVTIKDLAKKLNVNISTISRALKNHKDISKEMQEKVKLLAFKLGYRPNQLAVKLRKKYSKSIAIIMPELSMFFSTSIIRAVEELVHEKGYNLIILHSKDSLKLEIESIELCLENGVDGVLISLTRETQDIEHIAELLYAEIPVILYDRIVEPSLIHQIVIHDKKAAELGTQELLKAIDNPDAQVLGIFGDPRLSITKKRKKGFEATMKKNKNYRYTILYNMDNNIHEQLQHVWKKKNEYQGLFLMSDELLSFTMRFLLEKQIQLGKVVQIVCMSDGYFPQLFYPPIPYIHTSGYTMGKKAVEVLFELIQDKSKMKHHEIIVVDTPFVPNA